VGESGEWRLERRWITIYKRIMITSTRKKVKIKIKMRVKQEGWW